MNQIVCDKVGEFSLESVAKKVAVVAKVSISKKVHKLISSKFFNNAKKHQEQISIEKLRANRNQRYLVML